MSYFNRIGSLVSLLIICIIVLLSPVLALAQYPSAPAKTPELPQKTTPSPQAAFSTPQSAQYQQQDQPVVLRAILQAPSVYAIQRQVIVRDIAPAVQYDVAPVSCDLSLAYAGGGCGVQQQVIQRNVIQHQVVANGVQHSVIVNHNIGAAVGRAPRKVVTKTVTKTRGGGLLGRLFGG